MTAGITPLGFGKLDPVERDLSCEGCGAPIGETAISCQYCKRTTRFGIRQHRFQLDKRAIFEQGTAKHQLPSWYNK